MRLRMRVARPMARGRKRLSVGPSSAYTAAMRRSSPTSSWLCSALATADSSSLRQSFATARGVKARIARASRDVLAADVVADQARLARGGAHVLGLRADRRRRPATSRRWSRLRARARRAGVCSRRLLGGFFARAASAARLLVGRPRPARPALGRSRGSARRPSSRAASRAGFGSASSASSAACSASSAATSAARALRARFGFGASAAASAASAFSAASTASAAAASASGVGAAASTASSAAAAARAASSSARSICRRSFGFVGHRTLPDFSWPR